MPSVPAALLEHLVAARRGGLTFEAAWPVAIAAAVRGRPDRDEWRAVLQATRLEWQEAFVRRPARRRMRALIAVASDPERVPLDPGALVLRIPLGERPCSHCGELIATTKKRSARYCSHVCQRAANGRPAVAA